MEGERLVPQGERSVTGTFHDVKSPSRGIPHGERLAPGRERRVTDA